ncbi:MAG: hypothetical protein JWQ96_3396 [Segetibacter sp.]|nr:hypothetical protein [Segetibacter sp.]
MVEEDIQEEINYSLIRVFKADQRFVDEVIATQRCCYRKLMLVFKKTRVIDYSFHTTTLAGFNSFSPTNTFAPIGIATL